MNSLQPVLEFLIGTYQYNLFILPNNNIVSTLGALDYAYFVRAIFLLVAFVISFNLLNKTIGRLFGKVTK